MSDLAGEVVRHLQSLQDAEDKQRPLILRSYSRSSDQPRTMSIKHNAGRKFYVLHVDPINDEELMFESERCCITAFLRACRSVEYAFGNTLSCRIGLYHSYWNSEIMTYDVG